MTTSARPQQRAPLAAPAAAPHRAEIVRWVETLHDDLTALFTALDQGGTFAEVAWVRPGGGGGVARTLADGETFEKAGINRSCVEGALTPEAAARLGEGVTASRFFAAGVSLVIHPRSPHVPTLHLNVRRFELTDAHDRVVDAWFGGGTDLTPTWPQPDDARDFHRALRDLCTPHGAGRYAHYKQWCDEYFVNAHRAGEARGVGGIFFDHLRDYPASPRAAFEFARVVGRAPAAAYAPIVERRRDAAYGERERRCQLARRGRYVEFNLLHDRGTHFGLRTDARVESVLMSLPPLAAWPAPTEPEPGSPEATLRDMLRPRDWAAAPG